MITEKDIYNIVDEAKLMPIHPNPMFPPSVYYRFLFQLAKFMKPKLSVELGVAGGGASLHLANGWPDGIVYGIDIVMAPESVKYVTKHCPNFRYRCVDSVDVSANFYFIAKMIDILFIDTIHTYERTMEEFRAYLPLMVEGSVVILDDLFRPGMDRAWNDIPGTKVRLDDLHIGGSPTDGGFGVILL